MKLIISPAKKMNVDTDTLAPLGEPVLLEKTEALLSRMREFSYEEIAAELGLPMGTVKTQIHRAREHLCRFITESQENML